MIWFESGIGIRKELHYLDEPCVLVRFGCVKLRQIYVSFDAVALYRGERPQRAGYATYHGL